MWTYKSLLGVLVCAVIVLLVIWWVYSAYAGIVLGYLASALGYLYVNYNHSQTLQHPKNISLYGHDSFPWICHEIRRHLVFKKCNFNHNRAFWLQRNRLDLMFYTDHCEQEETITRIISTCFLDKRTHNIDKYVELYLISMILLEDIDLLTAFVACDYVEYPRWLAAHDGSEEGSREEREEREEKLKNSICWVPHLDRVGLNEFFRSELKVRSASEDAPVVDLLSCDFGLKPDVCLRIVGDTGQYTPVIIDVYNGTSKKKIDAKLKKYNKLKEYINDLVVAVLWTNPQRTFESHVNSYDPEFYGDPLDNLITITEDQKRSFSRNTVKFLGEVNYWRQNKSLGEICRSHR